MRSFYSALSINCWRSEDDCSKSSQHTKLGLGTVYKHIFKDAEYMGGSRLRKICCFLWAAGSIQVKRAGLDFGCVLFLYFSPATVTPGPCCLSAVVSKAPFLQLGFACSLTSCLQWALQTTGVLSQTWGTPRHLPMAACTHLEKLTRGRDLAFLAPALVGFQSKQMLGLWNKTKWSMSSICWYFSSSAAC